MAFDPAFPRLELFSDANASRNRFAITDHNGNPVWYGRFGDDDPIYNGEQSMGELSAAVKAVQFAGKVREHNNLDYVNLLLNVNAKWLCWANSTDRRGGETLRLADAAAENMVILQVQWVPGNTYQYTTIEGGKNWDENDLEGLMPARPGLELFSDAKASRNQFGITDQDGNPVWYGQFGDDDPIYNGEQSMGELSAAVKAVQFAGKVREHNNLDYVNLLLNVDAEWLCWANSTDGRGGEALRLADVAAENMVDLQVQWVPGNENPADYYTTAEGGKNWDENDLEALFDWWW